jgi:hypothetical protein
MAGITLPASSVHDRFPVGTVVNVYPRAARVVSDAPPVGAAITSATVGASSLAFTGLTNDTPYTAYALVNGKHVYVGFRIPNGSAAPTWQSVVSGRRAARGSA